MSLTALEQRKNRLLPNGIPRYIRCYDSGPDGSIDRYTVVFTKKPLSPKSRANSSEWAYLAMNGAPYDPQGFGQHGSTSDRCCDRPTASHLGKKIKFSALPSDCQHLVLTDYADHWGLNPPMVTVAQVVKLMQSIALSPATRLKLVQIADKALKKYGNGDSVPFQQVLNAWYAVPELTLAADIAKHQAYATTKFFV